jgi:hypothetical protein
MGLFHRISVVLLTSLVAAGCATVEKTALSAESKKKIKTVAFVSTKEPEKYFLNPGQAPGGFMLYAFGALGGAILGGIEATRIQNATNEFTAAIKPTNPDVAQHWNSSVLTLLQSKGYEVTQLAELPMKPDGKEQDCTVTTGKYDAVLVSTIGTGYAIESAVEPRVMATLKLMSDNCTQTHFSDVYVYSEKPLGKFTHIERDTKFSFANREALIADPQKAKEALRTGLAEIAKKAAAEF